MSDEYLSKEEIKKWRSSVEKITLEEYAARLGKKLQEEKKTNDLADMLYTHFNPSQMPKDYDTVTKLEKIDLTPKAPASKSKKVSKTIDEFEDDLDIDGDMMFDEESDNFDEQPVLKEPKVNKVSEPKAKVKESAVKEKKVSAKEEPVKKAAKEKKAEAPKKSKPNKKEEPVNKFAELNITFKKALTDREEKVLAYFVEKRGEIVYAKDIAELLDLKRDYIYKYIKNLRAKMAVDLIANADNGGFKLQ